MDIYTFTFTLYTKGLLFFFSIGVGLEKRIGVVDVKSSLVQFSVVKYRDGDQGEKITFSKLTLNAGNGFDWENQLFRAPHPGNYFFSVSGTKELGISGRAVVAVLVNGVNIGEAVSSHMTDHGGFSIQVVVKLAANDKVELSHWGKVYELYFNGWILNENLII